MLVRSLKPGRSLYLGDRYRVQVLDIQVPAALLSITSWPDGEFDVTCWLIRKHDLWLDANKIKVFFTKISPSRAHLAVNAPIHLIIRPD